MNKDVLMEYKKDVNEVCNWIYKKLGLVKNGTLNIPKDFSIWVYNKFIFMCPIYEDAESDLELIIKVFNKKIAEKLKGKEKLVSSKLIKDFKL